MERTDSGRIGRHLDTGFRLDDDEPSGEVNGDVEVYALGQFAGE